MTNDLANHKSVLSPKAEELIRKYDIDLKVGDFVIDDDGRIYKITKVNSRGIEISSNSWTEDGSYSHYSTIKLQDWKSEKYLKLDGDPDDQMLKVLTDSADLSKYEEDQTPSDSKEMMVVGDKNHLNQVKKSAELMARKLEVMNRLLERKRNELDQIMRGYLEKVKSISKMIALIELYLGIHEQLMQIGDGEAASIDTPISLRQQVLYMDEELGDPTDGGIDFRRIEEFDVWLTKDNNISKLLPEEKGVVVLKTRRSKLEYSSDWFTNALMNSQNDKSYILIRNGSKIYRIWTEHLSIDGRLFPLRKEMDQLQRAVESGGINYGDENDDEPTEEHERGFTRLSEEDARKELEKYRKNMLMLQGLLDRSEVFNPLPISIQLHKPETYGKMVQFIYDDELALGDGHSPWKEWQSKLNASITRGTRIYFTGFWTGFGSPYTSRNDYWESRFPYHLKQFAHYDKPQSGIYSIVRTEQGRIEGFGEKKEGLICHYNPGDTPFRESDWYSNKRDEGVRKKSIPFTVFKEDQFVFNYDLLDLNDIEFYIHSRADRGNYLKMLPTLYGLKKMRHEELKWELGFVENLVLHLPVDDKKYLERVVWESIEWWKRKVIWKRPLTKEDSKALRMITWKVKKHFGLKTSRSDLALPKNKGEK